MPAYNAELTLEKTFNDIPEDFRRNLVLVDDCSSDATVEVALRLGIDVVRHSINKGYGGNQKTCYRKALELGADIIVMLHPDYQYDARVVGIMAELIDLGNCQVLLGNRIRTRKEALDGGMPRWKYFINRASTFMENFILGQSLGDFHSGLRAYSREVLTTIPFDANSDDFAFDQEFLIQSVHFGFRLGDIPVPVRYFDEASSINFRRSLRYGIGALNAIGARWIHNSRIRKDIRFFEISHL
jgi:glycosyltransferase involved in cell wall biosynthesis